MLNETLGYHGVFHADIKLVDEPGSFFGNAVFSKWPIIKSKVVFLKTFRQITPFEFNSNVGNIWAQIPRHMLDVTVDCGDLKIHAISVHGRRVAPPVDDEENIRQAKVIADYLKSLKREPFVMGGDFNMPLGSQVVKIVSEVSNNLMEDVGVSQTLNPEVHELGKKGYLVDFVFTSSHFKKVSVDVPQITVSDHLPVIAELELNN